MKYVSATLVAVFAAFCIFVAGVGYGASNMKKDAVIHDKAQWVSDTEGRVKFEWKK